MKLIILFFLVTINSFAQTKNPIAVTDSIVQTITGNNNKDSFKYDAKNVIVKIEGEKKDRADIWIPVIVAIIVAFAAYRGVIKQSKANSISAFRVNWIDDLRECYSKFLLSLRNVDIKIRDGKIDPKKYSKDSDEEDLFFLKTKIKLLLFHNPNTNPDHLKFYEHLVQYMVEHKTFYGSKMSEDDEKKLDTIKAQMEEVLLKIFNSEWEKAKKLG